MNRFGEQLDALKVNLLEMSSLVERGIQQSVDAVVKRDRRAANEVLDNERKVNAIELEIDAQAIELLALHQPMASNLRFIIAALKINSNLERMHDLSVVIAHSALSLADFPAIDPTVDVPLIAGLVQVMVRKSLDAFVTSDVELARTVLFSDDAVDALRTTSDHSLLSFMKKDARNISPALQLLSVTRALERLADHSTNIAEDVLFFVSGVDVRHHAISLLNE